MSKLSQLLFIESYILVIFIFSIFEIYKKNIPNKIFKLNLIILNLFLIFQEIGVDVSGYKNNIFLTFEPQNLKTIFFMKSQIELGFRIILNFFRYVNLNFYFFMLFISSINLFIIYKILHNKRYKYMYYYFYLIINIYILNTNYLRQGLALHIFLYSIYLNIDRKEKIKSKIYCLFSILLHKTAIVTLPIIYLKDFFKDKLSIFKTILFFIFGFFIYSALKKIFLSEIFTMYSGKYVLVMTIRNYFLYLRKGMEYPTIFHEILFKMYILFTFIINFFIMYMVKNNKFENKLTYFLYRMMILGIYFSAFFVGMGIHTFGIYEMGMRSGLYFFIGNFLLIGDYIKNKRNKLIYIVLIAFIIRIFSLFVLLQTNRHIGIIPNLFK